MEFSIRVDEQSLNEFIKEISVTDREKSGAGETLGCAEDFAEYLRLAGIGGDAYITEPDVFIRISHHIVQFYVSSLLIAAAFLTRQIIDDNIQVRQITGPACRNFSRRHP